MDSYFLFFIILTSIFIVPQLLKRFNIPTITATMLAGLVIGPFGLNLLQTSPTLDTFASFGVIFLMFLARITSYNVCYTKLLRRFNGDYKKIL